MLPKFRQPSHPGEILLEEFLNPLQLTQSDFVRHLGGSWTQPKLSAVIGGKRALTEAMALDFAEAFGTTPEFWMNLQRDVNLWHALHQRKKGRRLRVLALPMSARKRTRSARLKGKVSLRARASLSRA